MLRRHRNSLIIGLSSIVLATIYGALAPVFGYHIEWAGVTMLIALGVALGIMVGVLEAGLGD
jgi:uncharacterized membrane protein (DUF485 family)